MVIYKTLPSIGNICTGPINCVVAFFNLYPGERSDRATAVQSATTTDQCEIRCRLDPACLAYQTNTNPNNVFCWHQKLQDRLQPGKMFTGDANIVELVKVNNCSGTFLGQPHSSLCICIMLLTYRYTYLYTEI